VCTSREEEPIKISLLVDPSDELADVATTVGDAEEETDNAAEIKIQTAVEGFKHDRTSFVILDEPPSPSSAELGAARNQRECDALFAWYERLGELYAFKRRFGHCNIPKKYPENPRLSAWVSLQKTEKQSWDAGRLHPGRTTITFRERKIQELERIGIT
jgi:Helicase associated domain